MGCQEKNVRACLLVAASHWMPVSWSVQAPGVVFMSAEKAAGMSSCPPLPTNARPAQLPPRSATGEMTWCKGRVWTHQEVMLLEAPKNPLGRKPLWDWGMHFLIHRKLSGLISKDRKRRLLSLGVGASYRCSSVKLAFEEGYDWNLWAIKSIKRFTCKISQTNSEIISPDTAPSFYCDI